MNDEGQICPAEIIYIFFTTPHIFRHVKKQRSWRNGIPASF
ncbi:hypothetical protein CFter6_2605 [Collimonas fungivorans]|uniref:Uncharacterized protein n=1 Tax=Collimonas fungivorans TaxID=158899 RepID=A0A127PC73_9BURK|nr:hypothetical protein CFter6_2605 [Collimonas fungivorans]